MAVLEIFFYKFCPNLLSGGIDEDRALAKQSLLRWPCPLPSDRAIPVLWQNLESNVLMGQMGRDGTNNEFCATHLEE